MAKGMSVTEFNKALNNFAKRTVPATALGTQALISREIYRRILERTPVLTGRARRNWNMSFNAPNRETTEELAGVGVTGAPWTAQERARAQVIETNIQFAKLSAKVFINNSLPYIEGLELGTSMKAPQGIVEGAIQGALEDVSSRGVKVGFV